MISQLDAQLEGPRAPERLLVSQATWDRLLADFDFAAVEDVQPPQPARYKGVAIEVSNLVPDDRVFAIPARGTWDLGDHRSLEEQRRLMAEMTGADPFIRGEGTVTIDGEVIGTVNDRGETHRAVLSDPAYWKTVEDHAVSIEQRLTVADVELPAWVILRAGANAAEIGAELTLVHEIKPTTGGDRYHRVFVELDTGRGLLQEQVEWPPALKAPEPNAWHRALTDLGIIGG